MKAKWTMLNGNRLDETLRDATLRTKVLPFALKCYSSYVVLLFAGATGVRGERIKILFALWCYSFKSYNL